MSHSKIIMAIYREVIDNLEKAQESRQLTETERNLIKVLKVRLLGMAAIEKSRARQRSRITWLKKGDTNTKFFHIMANVRKRKNYIHTLQINDGLVASQSQKHAAIFNHFKLHTGTYIPRACSMNFAELGWEPRQLSHLELPFTEEEVKQVIQTAPKEKAPGLDGFIGIFSL
jgi:hypothetical protein